ncbi:fatty acyl-coa reductase 2 [Phtheirospermum japonicum]|uniref:Fatty acyl-CoA reductase n=1 Tax=Phtheirospermum japonicum TaxID=374723 RepID=A0A830BAR1_9LAMI|nr:fatty acyl-coa reductase 2 [Phtheirospermum japonicum]
MTKAALNNGHISIITDNLESPLKVESGKSIGITKYFEEKNIFITGATGIVGKVFVEKILRSTPVGKIYVLVKADDQNAAIDRLAKELINTDLFESLREKHGKGYQTFIKEKLIPVVGNICEPNLGMDSDSTRAITEVVNVIVMSAAITTLNERYDLLLNTNVKGPQRLMQFAKTCKNLELFVHFSTAYVNGEKEGIILEKPLTMGENRRKASSEISLFHRLDVADEINLAKRSSTGSTNYDIAKDMKRLGMERAKYYGWYNAYHLTKAMAEMIIHETRGDIPVLIIRPSSIESCYKEPVPGWIQGNKVFDPVIISYGKGQLPAFLANPDTLMDIIPLDLVVNATIAAIAKHGYTHKSELNVYQMASSLVNPLRFSEFFEYIHEYFESEPLIESQSFRRINYFSDFSKYTREELSCRHGMKNTVAIDAKETQKLQKQLKAKVTYAEQLCKMYEFVGFFKARFDAGNTQELLSEMSKEEKDVFAIDVTNINWKEYFQEVHIPGLRNHLLNKKRIFQ